MEVLRRDARHVVRRALRMARDWKQIVRKREERDDERLEKEIVYIRSEVRWVAFPALGTGANERVLAVRGLLDMLCHG